MSKISTHKHTVPKHSKKIVGPIFLTSKATGFVTAEGFKEDIEIPPENLATALHKDEVEITVGGKSRFGRIQGKVIKIIKRAKGAFVGTIKIDNGKCLLIPDDRRCYVQIEIPEKFRNMAKDGDKALVKITRWGNPRMNPLGNVEKVIGRKGDNTAEMHSIAIEKGFDTSYPEAVMREADELKKQNSPILHIN